VFSSPRWRWRIRLPYFAGSAKASRFRGARAVGRRAVSGVPSVSLSGPGRFRGLTLATPGVSRCPTPWFRRGWILLFFQPIPASCIALSQVDPRCPPCTPIAVTIRLLASSIAMRPVIARSPRCAAAEVFILCAWIHPVDLHLVWLVHGFPLPDFVPIGARYASDRAACASILRLPLLSLHGVLYGLLLCLARAAFAAGVRDRARARSARVLSFFGPSLRPRAVAAARASFLYQWLTYSLASPLRRALSRPCLPALPFTPGYLS